MSRQAQVNSSIGRVINSAAVVYRPSLCAHRQGYELVKRTCVHRQEYELVKQHTQKRTALQTISYSSTSVWRGRARRRIRRTKSQEDLLQKVRFILRGGRGRGGAVMSSMKTIYFPETIIAKATVIRHLLVLCKLPYRRAWGMGHDAFLENLQNAHIAGLKRCIKCPVKNRNSYTACALCGQRFVGKIRKGTIWLLWPDASSENPPLIWMLIQIPELGSIVNASCLWLWRLELVQHLHS